MCNTPINIILIVAILLLIFLLVKKYQSNEEKFSAGGFDSCWQNQVDILKDTCVPTGKEVVKGLIKPSEYKDPDKVDRCHAYDTRYDFSTPSNLFIKLA